ncbi:MAG: hypothetical protein AAF203_08225 [Pseudomonadota bacterium]
MKYFVLFAMLFSFQTVFAQEEKSELALEMQVIGGEFRTIALALRSQKMTTTEVDASKKMQRAIANASLLFPENADTDELKLQYAVWMAELMKKSLALEDAITVQLAATPQVLADINQIFNEMNDLRKQGHGQFKTN